MPPRYHNNDNLQPIPTVLNVAEKPSVARALAGVFSRMPGARDCGMRRDANQVFTHDSVQFPSVYAQGQGVMVNGPIATHKMITTSVRGHLASQDFPAQYGWSRCDPMALFEAPIETLYRRDMEPLERMLRQLASQCNVLILWLDCDREGEAIGDEVRQVCLTANPRLKVLRARFSTVLAVEIQRALKTLGTVNENFVQAVQARSELDLRVGAAFTRFQTLRLQRRFDGISEQSSVVSYGPCQFPTLGFVVERWARIQTFLPEDFWFIELTINVIEEHSVTALTGRSIQFTWKRGRLYDRLLTTVLYESCLDSGEAVVTRMQGRPKNRWRPVPLSTIELQKRASKFLRLGSETLMTAAEELYHQGLISYPRTETERFRPEFQHRPLIQQLAESGGVIGDYSSRLLNGDNFQMPRAGRNDDQAHPPITPCKAVHPDTISDPTQRNVYILVVKHYLACCSRDAVGRETQLTIKMASEEFNATGLMILEKNWLEIYDPWERWTGQGELPQLQVGSRVTPSSLLLKEGRTTPPQPISEVELISLMDRNGIGTDATIAQHISTIQDRDYAIKDASQKFTPTPLGIALVEGYNSMGYQLNKPDLRREMEAECNMVANGQKRKEDIIAPILEKMRQCYVTVTHEAAKLDEAVGRHFPRLGSNNNSTLVVQNNFSICGTCRAPMALKQERNPRSNNPNAVRRKMVYCTTCQSGWNLPRGVAQPKTENDSVGGPPLLCPICTFQVIKVSRGEGYEGNGYTLCPKCFSDPPPEHGGARDGGEFRCFTCQHPTCSLAGGTPGGSAVAFPCPFCERNAQSNAINNVVARRTSRGYLLRCSKDGLGDPCHYKIWLPKECQTVTVLSGDENQNSTCNSCSVGRIVRKVNIIWKPGSVPPYMGRECIVCILCDEAFRREMSITLPQPNQVIPARAARQAGRGGGHANRGGRTGTRAQQNQGNGRGGEGNVCYRCGQPGHFANACQNR